MRRYLIVLGLLLAASPAVHAQVIEDFESYADQAALQAVWGPYPAIDLDTIESHSGTQSLKRTDENAGPASGGIASRTFGVPLDLSGEKVSVWVRRSDASVNPSGAEIALGDGAMQSCVSGYLNLTDTAWHQIVLDTTQSCGFVDLTDIVIVYLHTTNSSAGSGKLEINFDDIEHYLFRDGFESGDTAGWSSAVP